MADNRVSLPLISVLGCLRVGRVFGFSLRFGVG